MTDTERAKLTYLELVIPPISNQEAVWYKDEPVAEYMKQSDFYMIGGKTKSLFGNVRFNDDQTQIFFDLFVGDDLKSSGIINIGELQPIIEFSGEDFGIASNEDEIEFFYEENDQNYLLARFTPENILWYRSRDTNGISGLDNYKEIFVYDLLYVGIAKQGDSYQRLIQNGHQARQEILANEPQRYPGARVSDETFLFLFRLQPIFMTSFGDDPDFDLDISYAHKQIVADAEKAFVSLLKPEYNVIKFKQYPKGKDGLHSSNLDRYGYSIGEAITFNTPHGKIKGGRDKFFGAISNEADFIFVDKKSAELFISGIDFPANQIDVT